MHSQWFLADLTTDAIDLLCYLSLKYSEKNVLECIIFLVSVMSMI